MYRQLYSCTALFPSRCVVIRKSNNNSKHFFFFRISFITFSSSQNRLSSRSEFGFCFRLSQETLTSIRTTEQRKRCFQAARKQYFCVVFFFLGRNSKWKSKFIWKSSAKKLSDRWFGLVCVSMALKIIFLKKINFINYHFQAHLRDVTAKKVEAGRSVLLIATSGGARWLVTRCDMDV